MEVNLVRSHLLRKLSSNLEEAEAEADLRGYSQIISYIRSLERLISTINQDSDRVEVRIEMLYELMDALSECTVFAQQAASKKGFFRVVLFKRKIAYRLNRIDMHLKHIFAADRYNNRSDQNNNTTAGPDVPDPSQIMGFESEVREIEEMITPTELRFKPIGIVGRCGCGKTALAQKVFASTSVENKFFPRIWVSLSDESQFDNKEKILNHILREIGPDAADSDSDNYSVVQLLEMLRLRLMGKRYLIVLDGVWRMDEWFADLDCTGRPEAESLTNGLPKESGGAVIVTSRREEYIRRMVGENHVIRPQLSDDVCWRIFYDDVVQQGKITPDHPKLIQMKDTVIKNCDGLPLAAKILADTFSNLLAEQSEVQL